MQSMESPIQPGWDAYGSDDQKIGTIRHVSPSYLLIEKGIIFVHDLYVPAGAVASADAASGRVVLTMTKDEVEQRGWTEPPDDGAASEAPAADYTASADTARESGETQRIARHEDQLVHKQPRVVEELEITKVPQETVRQVSETVRRENIDVEQSGDVHVSEGNVGSARDMSGSQQVSAGDTEARDEHSREHGAEMVGGAAGAVGGALVGGAIAGPPGAVIGGVIGAAGGAATGEAAEGPDKAGSALGGGGGALGGAVVGGALAGPPGALVGGAVGAAAGSAAGDKAESETDEADDRDSETRG